MRLGRFAQLKGLVYVVLSVMLLGVFNPQWLLAHRINVFASVDGDQICGYVYTANGTRVSNAVVRLSTAGESDHVKKKTDANGEFCARPLSSATHRIVARTGDGHRAEWTIPAQALTAISDDTVNKLATDASDKSAPVSSVAADTGSKSLQPIVKDEVAFRTILAEELLPLRRDLDRMENRIRVQDALGGIGYIVGIAGIIAYVLALRRKGA